MKSAFVLTNGYVEETAHEFNYARVFRTLTEAEQFAKIVNIQLKYDLHEIEVPEDAETVNIIVAMTSSNDTHIRYVENYGEFSKVALGYYERQHRKRINDKNKNESTYCSNTTTRVKNNVLFRNELTIVQMFGQRELNQNSYIYVGNIPFHSV